MLSRFLARKKIVLIILCFFLLSALLSKPIQAFSTRNDTYQFQFENAVFKTKEMNLQSFVYEVIKAIMGSTATTIGGCISCPREEASGFGMIGTVSTLIAGIYATPPASGIEYLADIGKRLDLIQPTYAQEEGMGFGKLRIYQPIWKAFRNITYVFFILIFIFIGFAIMFRVKINPQTVITIQSALPKVVLALLLVTFSYAIVGFLIDLMYVISNLIMFTFSGIEGVPDFVKRWFLALEDPQTSSAGIFLLMFRAGLPPFLVTMMIMTIFVTTLIVLTALPIPGVQAVTIPVGIGGIIILVLFLLVFLIALIRVLWTLLKAYVFVVLNLIFAPFQILMGALPGSNAVGAWFRSLLANLAVLPTVLVMVFLSGYLTLASIDFFVGELVAPIEKYLNLEAGVDPGDIIQNIGNIIIGILNNTPNAIFSMLIMFAVSLGILLITPRAADMIKAFLAGKPFEYGAAIGEALGPAMLAVRYPVGIARAGIEKQVGERAGKIVLKRGRGAIDRWREQRSLRSEDRGG